MTKDPTRGFMLRLTEAERARVEAYRAANGLRSLTGAIRHLIERRAGIGKPYMEAVVSITNSSSDLPQAHPHRVAVREAASKMTEAGISFGPVAPKPGDRPKKGK